MFSNPLLSIIINCFNGEKYLSECLKSILNQTYENYEVIFWDNKSTDNSKNIFLNYYLLLRIKDHIFSKSPCRPAPVENRSNPAAPSLGLASTPVIHSNFNPSRIVSPLVSIIDLRSANSAA